MKKEKVFDEHGKEYNRYTYTDKEIELVNGTLEDETVVHMKREDDGNWVVTTTKR